MPLAEVPILPWKCGVSSAPVAWAGSPVVRFHSRMALSSEPVAMVSESGLHATQDTPAMWPTSVSMWAPVSASQIMAVPSAEAEAIHRPSGEMRTCETARSWPRSSRLGWKSGRRGLWRSRELEAERRGVRREEDVREQDRERDGGERESNRERERERERDRERDGGERDLEPERALALALDLDLDPDLDLEGDCEREL